MRTTEVGFNKDDVFVSLEGAYRIMESTYDDSVKLVRETVYLRSEQASNAGTGQVRYACPCSSEDRAAVS
jgi:hypothetical protein